MGTNILTYDFDVIVCGGGTAGSVAAIRAARLGLRTAVVERQSQLGGSSTVAMVTPQMANRCCGKDLVGGISRELQTGLADVGYGQGRGSDPVWNSILLEQLACREGVTLFYHSELIDVRKERNLIAEIELAGLGKRIKLRASYFVDATGDALLSMLAGEPTKEGSETDGDHQPMSLRFALGNVDMQKVIGFVRDQEPKNVRSIWPCSDDPDGWPMSVNLKWLDPLAKKSGYFEGWENQIYLHFYTIPGKKDWAAFNAPRIIQFDPTDPLSLSEAYADGRKQIAQYWRFLRDHVPGFDQCCIAQIASMIGIRECRRIQGNFILTQKHVRNLTKFTDAVCLCNCPVDIHSNRNDTSNVQHLPPDKWYEIPYRALLPLHSDNLIVAGRCISSDFVAQSSYRIIPCCQALGEAAAYACYLAHSEKKPLPVIDAIQLRQRLFKDQVLLEPDKGSKETNT